MLHLKRKLYTTVEHTDGAPVCAPYFAFLQASFHSGGNRIHSKLQQRRRTDYFIQERGKGGFCAF